MIHLYSKTHRFLKGITVHRYSESKVYTVTGFMTHLLPDSDPVPQTCPSLAVTQHTI